MERQSIPGEKFHWHYSSRAEAKEIQTMVLHSLELMGKGGGCLRSQFTIIVTLPGADHERKGNVFVATKRKSEGV